MNKYIFNCYAGNGVLVTETTVEATNYWVAKYKAQLQEPGYFDYRLKD